VSCEDGGILTAESYIIVVLQSVDCIDLASDIEFSCGLVKILDCWVLLISAKNLLGFLDPENVSRFLLSKAQEAYLSGL